MKRISEPVYDEFITVSDAELPIVESPHVQRLRRIHQLGHSHYVYPAATHSRFEHSLGVMHLAGKMANSLGLTDDEIQAYRLGGLLHDIGHPPYSHSLESIMEKQLGISHEERTCILIDTIEAQFPVSREWVKDIVMGRSEYDIVAGEVDVDRMDYLQRDSQRTDIGHGNVDATALISFAQLHNGKIVFPEQALPAIEALFDARRRMTTSVYRHHTAVIIEAMLERSVEEYIHNGHASIHEIVEWDDYKLHTYLEDSNGVSGELYNRISKRKLYKEVFTVNQDDIGRDGLKEIATIENVEELEKRIAHIVGADAHEVLIDLPEIPSQSPHSINILTEDATVDFNTFSSKQNALLDDKWRNTSLSVYAPHEYTETINQTCQKILSDTPSQLGA